MIVVEHERIVIDDDEVDEFLCHLYWNGRKISLCGIHETQDPHCQMHHDNKNISPPVRVEAGPGDRCPTCAAPICQYCLALWEEARMFQRAANAFR